MPSFMVKSWWSDQTQQGDGGGSAGKTSSGGSGGASADGGGGGQQRLRYETVVSPTIGADGELTDWSVQWKLDHASQSGGWIVQNISASFDVEDAFGSPFAHPANDGNWDYWEAWRVPAGSSVTSYAAHGDILDDTYNMPGAGMGTTGTVTIAGSARFYEGLDLPSSFAAGNVAHAGMLPSTSVDPALFVNPSTPAVSHTYTWMW